MANVLLIGRGPTAYSALESILEKFTVVGVVRRPRDVDDPVVALARKTDIPVFPDESPSGIDAVVSRLTPDAVVVSSYHRLLPAALLARCPFVNVHYAPLPRYRGVATVNWALINEEPCTAITIAHARNRPRRHHESI